MPKKQAEYSLSIDDLLGFVETPQSDEILRAAAEAVGKNATKSLLDIATTSSGKSSSEQRGRAIHVLSRLGSNRITAQIAKLTRDKDALVRQHAIRALPRLDPKLATKHLLDLVSEPNVPEIEVAQALQGLAEIGDAKTALAIEKWASKDATAMLKVVSDEVVGRIRGRMADDATASDVGTSGPQ